MRINKRNEGSISATLVHFYNKPLIIRSIILILLKSVKTLLFLQKRVQFQLIFPVYSYKTLNTLLLCQNLHSVIRDLVGFAPDGLH